MGRVPAVHASTGGDVVRLMPLTAGTGDPGSCSPDKVGLQGYRPEFQDLGFSFYDFSTAGEKHNKDDKTNHHRNKHRQHKVHSVPKDA